MLSGLPRDHLRWRRRLLSLARFCDRDSQLLASSGRRIHDRCIRHKQGSARSVSPKTHALSQAKQTARHSMAAMVTAAAMRKSRLCASNAALHHCEKTVYRDESFLAKAHQRLLMLLLTALSLLAVASAAGSRDKKDVSARVRQGGLPGMGYVQYPSDETWVDAGVSGQVLEGVEAHYAAAKRQDEYASIYSPIVSGNHAECDGSQHIPEHEPNGILALTNGFITYIFQRYGNRAFRL
ncbi:hypothetical protein D0860_03011 [Hortaea werneckii]|uniref:Uncharacterized protein n=1 Tax=Hortaea werneckii TaxID=91943 RepID=A0A3M7HH86_HORWE|nr:hypothetical protein D0860_03011 [Hortaea werneckii]